MTTKAVALLIVIYRNTKKIAPQPLKNSTMQSWQRTGRQYTVTTQETAQEELCQIDTIPPTSAEASIRKQIVHEILHPEDRPAPQKRIYGINYSALEAAVRRIQQDVDFLMKYLPKVPDDAYVKVETTKILKQHKAYMAQFEDLLNDEKVA